MAENLGVPVTRVHDLIREGALLAVSVEGARHVPQIFLTDDGAGIVRFLPGLVAVLRDGGYADDEIVTWLFTVDESLPGRPVEALHGHGAREVMRRAQAKAF